MQTDTIGRGRPRRGLWLLVAAAGVVLMLLPAGAAEAPTLGLYCASPHGMVIGADAATVHIRLFSWDRPEKPLEVRHRLVDWRGAVSAEGALPAEVNGQWVRPVEVKLPRLGPYAFEAELRLGGQDKPLRTARLPLVRAAEPLRLTPDQLRRSPIAVNTHYNAPWRAFAGMGIHWARDYCWGWLGEGQKAPMASNGVDFARIHADSKAAGLAVLPCMMSTFRTDDKKRYIDAAARIRDGYERLSRAFPDIPYWELDNESDLQFHSTSVGYEEYMASYVGLIRAAADGLRKAGHGAKLALNGDAGIYPQRTARLLASPARDDFEVVNFHYYTGTVAPELSRRDVNVGSVEAPAAEGLPFLDLLRQIARLAHENGKQAWMTEVGWDVTYGPAVGERLQAIYLARLYLLGRFCGVDKVFWFFDRDGKGIGRFDSCGLLDLSGWARPSASMAVPSRSRR